MNAVHWPQVKALFGEAMERPASQRTSFLLTRCPDPDVLHEVHRLLQLDRKAGRFLSDPVEVGSGGPPLEPALEPGQVLKDRYRIDRLIGKGGMCGGVYEAFDLDWGIRVAVKVTTNSREFLAAREVTHTNVCRVYDCVRDGDLQFLVMELLDGETLEERLASRGPLDLDEMEQFAQQVCAGLAEAHSAGVLHRDLKPANVFLTASGRVVITDFGLAHIGGSCATSRQFIGTLPYMAPELFAGRKASVASDVYSLGVLLCEAATGKLPFEGAVPPGRWRRVVEAFTRVDPSQRTKDLNRMSGVERHGIVRFWRKTKSTACSRDAGRAKLRLGRIFAPVFTRISGILL